MTYPKRQKEHEVPVIPTTRDSSSIPNSMDEKRKDNASTAPPAKPKPKPKPKPAPRTPSTYIQEPSHAPSQTTKTAHRATARPGLQRRRTTAQTRYISMLLELDHVPKLHNALAAFFTWILLAGYIVFPATFNALADRDFDAQKHSALEAQALATVRNVPLLYVAAFACGVGVLGCASLWWMHRKNYVWVVHRIFLPSLMNSVAGLLSTLVNVYSAQSGQFSVTARATVVVTAALSVVASMLFLLYNSVMLMLVKRKHVKETEAVARSMGHGEGGAEEAVGGHGGASRAV